MSRSPRIFIDIDVGRHDLNEGAEARTESTWPGPGGVEGSGGDPGPCITTPGRSLARAERSEIFRTALLYEQETTGPKVKEEISKSTARS